LKHCIYLIIGGTVTVQISYILIYFLSAEYPIKYTTASKNISAMWWIWGWSYPTSSTWLLTWSSGGMWSKRCCMHLPSLLISGKLNL